MKGFTLQPTQFAILMLLAALSVVLTVGWNISNRIRDGALRESVLLPDLEVVALGVDQITLSCMKEVCADGDWNKEGVFGLEWEDGFGQVGKILEGNGQQVARKFFPLQGEPTIGELVRLDSFAAYADPEEPRPKFHFDEVTFASPLGKFLAWYVEGTLSTWVIFVHGKKRVHRRKISGNFSAGNEWLTVEGHLPVQGLPAAWMALHILPTASELGFPFLIISYRNDLEAPVSPDGFLRQGDTEWEDLEGAVRYAIGQGAENLILVGYSMGGAIVLNFLYQSSLADQVRGVILDSPMLDLSATLNFAAGRQRIPGLLEIGKLIAGLRFNISWEELNYLSRADKLTVPVLLFHGKADSVVPMDTSDSLAEARPDIVTYFPCEGATHVRCWNMDPADYEEAVNKFLQDRIQ